MLITTPVYAHHGTETTLTTIPIKQCMQKGRDSGKEFKSYFEMDELLYNGIIAYIYHKGEYVYSITCIKGYGKPDIMREARQSAKNREEDQRDSIQSILDQYK